MSTHVGVVRANGLGDVVKLHGPYSHRSDLRRIVEENHIFIYTSRFEEAPASR
jgi:hypothetical protein